MNILLKTPKDIETHFQKPLNLAQNLLSMTNQGEKAYGLPTGGMNDGFDITIGFFNNAARYIAFKKRSGTKWSEMDTKGALLQIGSWSNWASKPGSEYFDYTEKSGDKIVADATGWFTPSKRYCFVYVPVLSGEIGIMPDRTAIDNKF